jgi:hypothetical protein
MNEFEDKKKWPNAKLDEQIDKWRDIQGRDVVSAKSNLKNRAQKLEEIEKALECNRIAQESLADEGQQDDETPEDGIDFMAADVPADYELLHQPNF